MSTTTGNIPKANAMPIPPLNVASGPAVAEGRSDGFFESGAFTGNFTVGGGGWSGVVQSLVPAVAAVAVAWVALR